MGDEMKEKFKVLMPYIIIVLIVIFLKVYIVTPIRVNGPSMEPTLYGKDIMILNKTAYYFSNPERFDIVVISTSEDYIIKRVIGLPGEKMEYRDNVLYVNGEAMEEPFTHNKTDDFSSIDLGSETIPEDCYLVLGDNRSNSYDSRELGFIRKSQIVGSTTLTILPFNRFGWRK